MFTASLVWDGNSSAEIRKEKLALFVACFESIFQKMSDTGHFRTIVLAQNIQVRRPQRYDAGLDARTRQIWGTYFEKKELSITPLEPVFANGGYGSIAP